jgi:hypothetical protein
MTPNKSGIPKDSGEDCRIKAYPSFTNYQGINRIPPNFLMIDIDLKDFASKAKLDRAMNRILKKINTSMHGHPTVLWTDNGYHIYQPMDGFILEEEDLFAKFIDPAGKDLTSKFMQFAEDFLMNKKGDPQHHPTIRLNVHIILVFILYQDGYPSKNDLH